MANYNQQHDHFIILESWRSFKSIFILTILVSTLTLFSTNSYATRMLDSYVPFQAEPVGWLRPLGPENTYDRKNHWTIGLYAWIGDLYETYEDPETGLITVTINSNVGENWHWSFIDSSTGIAFETFDVTLISAIQVGEAVVETCFAYSRQLDGYSAVHCTTLAGGWGFGGHTAGSQCLPEGGYSIKLDFNGNTVHEVPFKPSKFEADKPKLLLQGNGELYPWLDEAWTDEIKNSGGEKEQINIKVEDDIERWDYHYEQGNCGVSIPNAPVQLTTTIVPNLIDHLHFNQVDMPSIGKIVSTEPVAVKEQNTENVFKALTDENGELVVIYQAGKYGLKEELEAVSSKSDGTENEKVAIMITTKVPDLISLQSSYGRYTLAGTESDKDLKHNKTGGPRHSHYVTPYVSQRAIQLDELYHNVTQHHISYNDASLPLGGLFDDGDHSNLDSGLHLFHRTGLDIDVNPVSSKMQKFVKISEKEYVRQDILYDYGGPGNKENAREILRLLAATINAVEYPEDQIHYRFLKSK